MKESIMNIKASSQVRSPQDTQQHLTALSEIEREMVAERLNLIRAMGRNISVPDLIERQAVAFVNVQARLNEARAERVTLGHQ
jgi:hypothetical protein